MMSAQRLSLSILLFLVSITAMSCGGAAVRSDGSRHDAGDAAADPSADPTALPAAVTASLTESSAAGSEPSAGQGATGQTAQRRGPIPIPISPWSNLATTIDLSLDEWVSGPANASEIAQTLQEIGSTAPARASSQKRARSELNLPSPPRAKEERSVAARIADSVFAGLDLDRKIGQLFITPANGAFGSEFGAERRRLLQKVSDGEVGGIIFMRGDVLGQATLTNVLQEASQIPLWITQDMEFGAAMRVSGTTRFTPAMGIASTGSPENAFQKGRITALEARALGVHQIFAPVLDVNNNPDNPVINVRSYSSDPRLVSEYGLAFINGVQSEGVMATGKHFPGHGDTHTDSHLALPVVNESLERLDSLELEPFRAAVRGGIQSIMTAHVAYPKISTTPGLPTTLDASVLNRLLRDSLNFSGLVVTDGLEMSAIASNFSPGTAVVEAFKAGAELMLISPDEPTAATQLKAALLSGEIPMAELDARVRKILTLKADAGLFSRSPIEVEKLPQWIGTPVSMAESERIARESVTLLRNEGNILPIRERDFPTILFVGVSNEQDGSAGQSLLRSMRNYHSKIVYKVYDRRSKTEEIESIYREAQKADLIIIGSFISVYSAQEVQLSTQQRTVLQRLVAMKSPSMFVSFGNPYILRELPGADAMVLSWSGNSQQAEQTAPALFGASEVKGTLPIDIPGIGAIGDGLYLPKTTVRFDRPESVGMISDSLLAIDRIMRDAIADSVFPGGVVGVVRKGVMVWNQAYGYTEYSKMKAVESKIPYDLASVSKVMGTTTSVMRLVEEGRISLQDRVSTYIPEFSGGDRDSVTIRHLLTHTSGLAPFRVYVDSIRTREEILNAVRNEPLVNRPGEKYVYSDLGFILLGEIVGQVSGKRLDRYVRDTFFYPMGMATAHYNPRKVGRWLAELPPPTEIDTVYDRGVVQGQVHDERAFFMDGVAGHAGLFGSSRDLAIWSTMLLQGGAYGNQRFLKPETIAQFTSRQDTLSGRGLGFDKKTRPNSTAGTLTGDQTFGHTGFTGTSIWIDPEEEVAIIILTNRTWPQRSYGRGISGVRSQIADAVMSSIASPLPPAPAFTTSR